MELQEAINFARTACESKQAGKLGQYALSYIEAMPEVEDTNGVRIQLLYFLSNLTSWRGPTARDAKKVMKAYAEVR